MLRENPDRNTSIYKLWEEGHTVDRISSETGIPRSTVGYYVRKFNKKAMKGEPIHIPLSKQTPDTNTLALQTI